MGWRGKRLVLFAAALVAAATATALARPSDHRSAARAEVFVDRPSLYGLMTLTYDNDSKRVARDMAEARRLGAKWVRTYIPAVKPSGKLDFADMDARLADIRRNGLRPLVALGGFADTCERRWQGQCPPTRAREKLYARHLRDLIARYRGKVTYWESWNEPDQTVFFRPRPSPERYARLLKLQYRVVKQANPRAQLLFAALGGTKLVFTKRILEALGGAKVFDAVAVHPYRWPPTSPDAKNSVELADGQTATLTMKEELLATADLFRQFGYGRPPFWITEFGWGAKDNSRVKDRLVTLREQAQHLERAYTMLRDDPELRFVKSAFWFNLRDYARDAIPNPGEAFFAHHGLESTNFTRKPAAQTYRRLATGGRGARRSAAAAGDPRTFAYDRRKPLEAIVTPLASTEAARAEKIAYRAADGQRVPALFVIPRSGSPPYPCVILQHGGGGNKGQPGEETDAFAELGFAAFAIDARCHGERGNDGTIARVFTVPSVWKATLRGTVIDLRRGIDYLETRPECDRRRIGFVGGSMGAIIGALLAGADRRVQAPVLLLGGGGWRVLFERSEVVLRGVERNRKTFARALRLLDPVDPKHWVGRISPRPVLMVNATRDRAIPPASARILHAAAKAPKRVVWIDAGHEVPAGSPQERRMVQEMLIWLVTHLRP